MTINPYQPPQETWEHRPIDKGPYGLFAILSAIGVSLLVAYYVGRAAYEWAAIRGMTSPEDYFLIAFSLCMTPLLIFMKFLFWWLSRPESSTDRDHPS
jgi:hypothetical protein